MPSTMTSSFRAGDVVLVTVPFTDGTGGKRRPAVVLLDVGDADVVVAPITSRLRPSTYHVDIVEWESAGLLKPSLVRLHKPATVDRTLVEQRLGRLHLADRRRLDTGLNGLQADIETALASPD